MKDLQIGVIGSGGRGAIAEYAHQPGKGSRVVACCDLVPDALAKNRATYGEDIFTTSEYHALLNQELDGVFITTPDFLHEEMAVAALEAGLAVYLEKPIAITTAGCDRILNTACRTGSRLYVGHNMRHMTFVRQMKDLIEAGAIGQVKAVWCRHFVGHGGDYYFQDWHAEARYSTGLLLQKGAHDIDIIHWLAGGYSSRVHGMGGLTIYGDLDTRNKSTKLRARPHGPENIEVWPPRTMTNLNHHIDVEDISMMEMTLDNGVFASYQQCHYTPDYWRSYTVIGDAGRLENFGNGEDGSCIKVWNKRKQGWNAPDSIVTVDAVPIGGHGGSDSRIINEFLNFARSGGKTTTSPLAARHSVAAGCAATYSIRNGGVPIDVPVLDPELVAYFEGGQSSSKIEAVPRTWRAVSIEAPLEEKLALNGSA